MSDQTTDHPTARVTCIHCHRLVLPRDSIGELCSRCEVERLGRELAEARGVVARLTLENAGLWATVVQPWTREPDGAKLWKVNLAWFDTAKTEEAARAMVRESRAYQAAAREVMG